MKLPKEKINLRLRQGVELRHRLLCRKRVCVGHVYHNYGGKALDRLKLYTYWGEYRG